MDAADAAELRRIRRELEAVIALRRAFAAHAVTQHAAARRTRAAGPRT